MTPGRNSKSPVLKDDATERRQQETDATAPDNAAPISRGRPDPDRPAGSWAFSSIQRSRMGTSVLGQQVGTINLPEFLVPHKDCFMVVVAGNCLAPDHILDGDAVLIDPLAPVNDGDICAVWWQGGKALKHVYRDRDAIRLVPSDPAYDTIILGPEHRPVTVGLVVAVIRPCE